MPKTYGKDLQFSLKACVRWKTTQRKHTLNLRHGSSNEHRVDGADRNVRNDARYSLVTQPDRRCRNLDYLM